MLKYYLDMKKLVMKTIGITVASILAVLLIIYGIMALGFPKNLASFYDGLGKNKSATNFMAKAYERSGDISDLDQTCVYAIKTGDNGLIAEYLGKLVGNDGFKDYCNATDKGVEYYDFMASKYIVGYYHVNSTDGDIVDKAFLLTDDYRNGSCAYTLIRTIIGGNKDKESINLFKEKLNSAMPNYSQQSKILAENDLAFINEYLNNH